VKYYYKANFEQDTRNMEEVPKY